VPGTPTPESRTPTPESCCSNRCASSTDSRCLMPDSRTRSHRASCPEPRNNGSSRSPFLPISRLCAPSNKNRSPEERCFTKMNDKPPEREYAVFQAIWFGASLTVLFFVVFNSIQNTSPDHTKCTSGMPPPWRFSILVG